MFNFSIQQQKLQIKQITILNIFYKQLSLQKPLFVLQRPTRLNY